MFKWALIFLVVALVAGLFGLSGLAGAAVDIAMFLFVAGLILAVITGVLAYVAWKKIT